jgi:hypothetical protein
MLSPWEYGTWDPQRNTMHPGPEGHLGAWACYSQLTDQNIGHGENSHLHLLM